MPAQQLDKSAGLRLAEATIGAVRLGIPAAAVVQAIPAPARTLLLPRRQGALSGIVEHDGALLPVVDLGRWVDVGSAPGAPTGAHILVLRAGTRRLGLRVDAVGGVVAAAPGTVARLYHDEDPEELFHSAVHAPESGHVLSLLDIERLALLAAAWSDAAGLAADPEAAPSAPVADASLPYALLHAGGARLAVPAADLVEVIPMPKLSRIGGPHGLGGAYCLWRGRHLPVLDCASVVPPAADAPSQPAAPLLAVVAHGGLALGLPVHAALQLAELDPTLAVPAGDGVAASAFDADGALYLLDSASLFARFPEAALSRPADAAPGAGTRADGQQAHNEIAYIVFEADGMQAVAIDGVEQVTALAAPAPTMLEWQGRAIPVADLRQPCTTEDAAAADAHLLVVRGPARHLACVVTRVHLLIPPGGGRLYRMGGNGAQPLEFITTGSGAEQASYRTVDLAAQAAARLAA